MSENFYRAFEDLHRGNRQDIMRRLQVYLPFVLPVARSSGAPCLDLGCGRGEWLQLLTEHGIEAEGVDLDGGMLQAAQGQGLKVRHADATQALNALPENSISVVSAFQLVEHLSFDNLQILVQQAHRVLVPGGLLILETPNPDNLRVASNNFYLDPSHIKPIPSLLLAFVTEHAGFARSKILGLQESPGLRFQKELQLEDVLAGASPDYAVVAQKAAAHKQPEGLALLFERDYGISTAELARAYSSQQNHALRQARLELQDLRDHLQRTGLELQDLRHQLHQTTNALHEQGAQLHSLLRAVHQSVLWRLSRALPWFIGQIRKLHQQGWRARFQVLLRKLSSRQSDPPAQKSEAALQQHTAQDPTRADISERARGLEAHLQPEVRERSPD